MNVYLRELRAYRRSTLSWILSLSGLIVVFMALFPAFTQDVEATRDLLSQLPEAVRVAFNIALSNFFTVYGFYGYLLSFAILSGAIQAMNVGTGVISKEVSGKTADFLMSKPMKRSTVMSAKLAAALTVILVTNVAFSAISYFTASGVAEAPLDTSLFLLLSSTMLLVQLAFLALGALFAVTIPKIKSVISVTLPTVFAFYIIGMVGDVLENESVRYISPFKFYDPNYIITNERLEGRYLAIEAAFVVVAIVVSYALYLKKDVQSPA